MGKGPGQMLEAKDPLLAFNAFSKMTVFSYLVCDCVRNSATKKSKETFSNFLSYFVLFSAFVFQLLIQWVTAKQQQHNKQISTNLVIFLACLLLNLTREMKDVQQRNMTA